MLVRAVKLLASSDHTHFTIFMQQANIGTISELQNYSSWKYWAKLITIFLPEMILKTNKDISLFITL